MLGALWSEGGGLVRGVPRRRLLVTTVVVASAFALGACDGGGSAAPPTTTSSTTTATVPGPGASLTPEQQAGEEAKRAYVTYRQTLDRVFQRGGTNAQDEFSRVATGSQLRFILKQAQDLQVNQWRQVGTPTVRSLGLDKVSLEDDQTAVAMVRVCLDASTDDAVDKNGRSIRKAGALNHFIELITIIRRPGGTWLVQDESDTQVKTC
jgi:hypothetical protein